LASRPSFPTEVYGKEGTAMSASADGNGLDLTEAGCVTPVSEAASEMRRGRPRLWGDDYLAALVKLNGSRARSRRQEQNHAYAYKAVGAIVDDSPGLPADGSYAWIACDRPPWPSWDASATRTTSGRWPRTCAG
jgi:hypothetical protein